MSDISTSYFTDNVRITAYEYEYEYEYEGGLRRKAPTPIPLPIPIVKNVNFNFKITSPQTTNDDFLRCIHFASRKNSFSGAWLSTRMKLPVFQLSDNNEEFKAALHRQIF